MGQGAGGLGGVGGCRIERCWAGWPPPSTAAVSLPLRPVVAYAGACRCMRTRAAARAGGMQVPCSQHHRVGPHEPHSHKPAPPASPTRHPHPRQPNPRCRHRHRYHCGYRYRCRCRYSCPHQVVDHELLCGGHNQRVDAAAPPGRGVHLRQVGGAGGGAGGGGQQWQWQAAAVSRALLAAAAKRGGGESRRRIAAAAQRRRSDAPSARDVTLEVGSWELRVGSHVQHHTTDPDSRSCGTFVFGVRYCGRTGIAPTLAVLSASVRCSIFSRCYCLILTTPCTHARIASTHAPNAPSSPTYLVVVNEPELAGLCEEDVLLVAVALAEQQVKDGALGRRRRTQGGGGVGGRSVSRCRRRRRSRIGWVLALARPMGTNMCVPYEDEAVGHEHEYEADSPPSHLHPLPSLTPVPSLPGPPPPLTCTHCPPLHPPLPSPPHTCPSPSHLHRPPLPPPPSPTCTSSWWLIFLASRWMSTSGCSGGLPASCRQRGGGEWRERRREEWREGGRRAIWGVSACVPQGTTSTCRRRFQCNYHGVSHTLSELPYVLPYR